MMPTDSFVVRPMAATDLRQVLEWRNSPSVRHNMLNPAVISMDAHQNWFERSSCDPDCCLLVFEHNGIACGFVKLGGTKPGAVAEWGFFVAPGSPKGTGSVLGKTVLRYAFTSMKLHKVYGRVLAFNQESIRLHCRLGFQKEGVLREQHCIGSTYHDLIIFGLLATDLSA